MSFKLCSLSDMSVFRCNVYVDFAHIYLDVGPVCISNEVRWRDNVKLWEVFSKSFHCDV